MKCQKLLLISVVLSIILLGCGDVRSPSENKNNVIENDSTDIDYSTKTLMDGIKYRIPDSWEQYEYKASKYSPADLGFGYYLETNGTINESSQEMIGYDSNSVNEGVEFFVRKSSLYQSLSASELLKVYKEGHSSDGTVLEDFTLGNAAGVYAEDGEKLSVYLIPLNNGILFGYRVISDKSKLTRHTEEISRVIDSITIDSELFE